MIKKRKIIKTLSLILLLIAIIGIVRYFNLFYDFYCLKDWNGDPDWEVPNYLDDNVAENKLEECALYGGDNLVFSQSCNGRYRYVYDAEHDQYNDSDYNIVRHAGATYGLLDLYKEVKQEKYLETGIKGLDFLCAFNYIIDWNIWAINYDLDTNVGTVSLAILGMVRYWEATNNEKYNIYVEKYSNFIVSQQNDDGSFAGRYGSDEEDRYYSGEAFFALSLAYEMLEKERYLKAMEKALEYYWSIDYEYNDSAFIPWASSGCARWYELTKNSDFLDFCFEMTDIQIQRQNLINNYDELGNKLYGYLKAPTVNTGVYLEGIGDALRVAKKVNDITRVTKYRDCLKAGIEWELSLQFRDIEQLGRPIKAFGGFHRGFTVENAYQVRIDYTQHAISAILRALREFNKTEINSLEIRDGIVDFEAQKNYIMSYNWISYTITVSAWFIILSIVYIRVRKASFKKRLTKLESKIKKKETIN